MGPKLFNGSDSESEDDSEIAIDEEFARRYEHNKKREDLHRYEELEKRGLIPRRLRRVEGDDEGSDSDESSSSDDDELVPVHSKKDDLALFENLIKIKNKDPIVKQKDVKLFESESDSDSDEEASGADKGNNGDNKRRKKAMYLKDVVAKHLIEEGPDFHETEENDNRKKLAYDHEQEEIRKAAVEAMDGDGDDDEDLLMLKPKNGGEPDESDDEELRKKLDEYFDKEDENAAYLKEFFLKKMWVDKKNEEVDDEELDMLSEDEKEVEKQEEYEYRYQENTGDQILSHARVVEGSVRKKVSARREQRKRKQERLEIARLEREEELRHLKNLKKKDMNEKVKKIMESAGIDDEDFVPLSAKELEEEFDPEEYDRMMKKAFGDEYYEAADVDPEFVGHEGGEDDDELEKPDFDKEDELLNLPKGWDGRESGDGFLAARERSLKHKVENDSDGDSEEGEEEEEEEVTKEVKRKRKRKAAILEKAKEAMLDEYYKLDYEDTIGDIKTRFKYGKVRPNRYGLTTDELLALSDKELNQYLSLKKIVPYKPVEWKVPNSKRQEIKEKAKEVLKQVEPNWHKNKKRKRKMDTDDANKPSSSNVAGEAVKTPLEETNVDTSKLSRNARRRLNKAHLKLATSRLKAYGKIESKPKKAKH